MSKKRKEKKKSNKVVHTVISVEWLSGGRNARYAH